jgi:hypothetical protein
MKNSRFQTFDENCFRLHKRLLNLQQMKKIPQEKWISEKRSCLLFGKHLQKDESKRI